VLLVRWDEILAVIDDSANLAAAAVTLGEAKETIQKGTPSQ